MLGGFIMIRFLDIVSFALEWAYVFVFFWIVQAFLPLRQNRLMQAAAFFAFSFISTAVIYSNDLPNLLGVLLGISVYLTIFHRGTPAEKLTAVLVFYPALIAVNYLMQDVGSRCFFSVTGAPDSPSGWTQRQWLISTAFHTLSLLLRLLFWILAWQFFRKYLRRITSDLTYKMWFIVDTLMLASFVSIFTIIYFMPENPLITYPICGVSIFSSFGCIYLASYICTSVQTAYHAQELEIKQAYYMDRMRNEDRVRSIYHDLKNHLLILQSQSESSEIIKDSVQELQSQIQEYESFHHTGNEFLDIIIRDKAKAAQEKQIDFSASVSFEDGFFIEPLDISTIFGNALDNAIEASEKLPADRRLITVRSARVRDLLAITVENNALPHQTASGSTTKDDAFLHGIGLPNIRMAAEKYDGQCSLKLEDGRFILKIIIPIP